MNRLPRYGFPFQYYNPYLRNNLYNNYNSHISVQKPVHEEKPQSNNSTERKNSKSDDKVWMDLFGIKLYFDDVLILSLLFFLYKEEVKDEGLFLALVLLLIS